MGAPVMRLESGRQPDDCAVWALHTYLGLPYEDVWKQVWKTLPRGTVFDGLYTSTILRVARLLGRPLKKVAKSRIDEDSYGILSVELLCQESAHTVVLRNGLVFDVDQTVWELQPWIDHNSFEIECLLTED